MSGLAPIERRICQRGQWRLRAEPRYCPETRCGSQIFDCDILSQDRRRGGPNLKARGKRRERSSPVCERAPRKESDNSFFADDNNKGSFDNRLGGVDWLIRHMFGSRRVSRSLVKRRFQFDLDFKGRNKVAECSLSLSSPVGEIKIQVCARFKRPLFMAQLPGQNVQWVTCCVDEKFRNKTHLNINCGF